MSDQPRPIRPDSRQLAPLMQRLDKLRCNVCGETQWVVHEELQELRPFANGLLLTGVGSTPVVSVACEKCGNMHLFSGNVLGISKPTR